MTPRSVIALAFLAVAIPAAAADVDEVIAKHIEAKGGRAAWDAIETLHATGEYTAFSKVAPFTLYRGSGNRYRLDHTLNDRRLILGYDGKQYWSEDAFSEAGPQPMSNPADLAVMQREVELRTPLFDYAERGFEVELLEGETSYEGVPTIGIRLKRADGSEETWHLDPETYLEVARESPGSDFGRPMPSRTYFGEFREVADAMIPHWVESQWYTRHRIMDIREIEANADVDDSVFAMPTATGMDLFQDILGEWSVKVETKSDPREPEFRESERTSVFTSALNGGLVEEAYTRNDGLAARRSFSYDRYRDRYLMTGMDAGRTYLDIQTGGFEDGSLVLSNLETDTPFRVFGFNVHTRTTVSGLDGDDGFTVESETSIDGGENWGLTGRLTYTRPEAETGE